jgi:hypothetical protein
MTSNHSASCSTLAHTLMLGMVVLLYNTCRWMMTQLAMKSKKPTGR